MSTFLEVQESGGARVPPVAEPLDEAVWQAWVAKGRAADLRSSAARMKAVKWVSIVALLVAAELHLGQYEVVVRFVVAIGATVMMFQAFHARHYAFAAVFGALVLLYNPVAPVFILSGGWQRFFLVLSTIPFITSLVWRDARLSTMTKVGVTVSKAALTLFLGLGTMAAATLAGDLSKYREFQLGTDVATIAKQAGVSASQAKDIHRRPALIQELQWRPQPLGWSSKAEAVDEVVFRFYDGQLFRIVVNYDWYQIEGLTTDDIVEAISAIYGIAATFPAPAKAAPARYGDPEEIVAQWQDPQYRFDLIRSSYGPTLRLTGVLKRLEGPAEAAILEATRLDDQEAPQRETARIATEAEAARTKLEKARLVNKPKFRP